MPSPVLKIIKRANKVDVDLLQTFDRGYYHHHRPSLRKGHVPLYGIKIKSRERDPGGGSSSGLRYPILQLITVLPRDVPYAKLWMQYRHSQNIPPIPAEAEAGDHSLFVTVAQGSYNELEAAFPGAVILEKAFAWPTSAVKWHSFSRLLRNRLAVEILSARDAAEMSNSDFLSLLWQQTLSAESDAVLYNHPNARIEDTFDRKWWTFSCRHADLERMSTT